MGNSSSQSRDEVLLDSRVIKISESVAKRLIVTSRGGTAIQPSIKTEVPMPSRQRQSYREDGNYVDDVLFQEFQKQEVINEMQSRAMMRKLSEVSEKFMETQPERVSFSKASEQDRVLDCFKSNSDHLLKCHQEVLDFTAFSKNHVQP